MCTGHSAMDIMAEKIHDSFSHYSEADRAAIAVYLALDTVGEEIDEDENEKGFLVFVNGD